MNGLELSEKLYDSIKDELFEGTLAELRCRTAIGLVGEGSECFGFDDAASRDHDWGPSLVLWLTDEDLRTHGAQLQKRYLKLTSSPFLGFAQRPAPQSGVQRRVGVRGIGSFYVSLLHANKTPETIEEWRRIPESGLAAATNGRVFCDPLGQFTRTRERLLAYYPEDLRLKKIASACMNAAQTGQYNFVRQAKRREDLAAFGTLARFQEAVIAACYALSHRYMPFYKWAPRGLGELGDFGIRIKRLLAGMLYAYRNDDLARTEEIIEKICAELAGELRRQGLSVCADNYLVPHAIEINAKIMDETLRRSDLMNI